MLIISYFCHLYSALIRDSCTNRTKIATVQTDVDSYTETRTTLKNKKLQISGNQMLVSCTSFKEDSCDNPS
jgi:hypothetical protein